MVDKRNVRHFAAIKGRVKYFRLGAIALLFLSGAASIIISILIIFSPLAQLRKDEQKARDYLAPFHLDMNKLVFINERSNSARVLLKDRTEYDHKIDIVESKMPSDVRLDGLTFAKKTYTFRFSSTNLSSLNDLISAIAGITGKGHDFAKIFLTSLSADQQSKSFQLVIDLTSV